MISGYESTSVAQSLYNIERANQQTQDSQQRIASGQQFNRAADNVAALSVATQLASELAGLRSQQQNAAFGQALAQVADGGLAEIQDALVRQQELATAAGNGALNDTQRSQLNQEFQSLSQEINRIANNTRFGGQSLLSGAGGSSSLVQSDAAAAAISGGTNAVQAFDSNTGGSLLGNGGAGQLQFVDGAGNGLSNEQFGGINSAVVGQFDSFSISNVSNGVVGTVNASINGIAFSGAAANGATSVVVSDGNGTNIELSLSNFDLSSQGAVNASAARLNSDFSNTNIQRTRTVNGTDFSGTALAGVTGGAQNGPATLRSDSNSTGIRDFRYDGNDGGANSNRLSVEVDGERYKASNVNDTISNGDVIEFTNGSGETLQVDFTGLENDITDIRTNSADQQALVGGLNAGFAQADSGIASGIDGDLNFSIGGATTQDLFSGGDLDISSSAGAAAASSSLSAALNQVTELRAQTGALQSRFDFASEQLESQIQNTAAAGASLVDTNLAAEATRLAESSLLAKASIATAAQGNKLQNELLDLLGG